jgi:putative aldouronate transport system substrate-binding protein
MGSLTKLICLSALSLVVITGTVFGGGQQGQNSASGGKEAVREIVVENSIVVSANGLKEVEDAINKITEPLINTRIKYLALPSGVTASQISLMIASGEKLDLVHTIPQGATSFMVMQAQNQLMDITDLVPKYAPELVKTVQDIIPGFLEGTKINGRLYGISGFYNKVSSDYYIARADMLDKYKIDIYGLKNLNDVEKVLDIFAKNEPNTASILTSTANSGANVLQFQGGAYYEDFSKPVFFDTLGDFGNRLAVVFLDNPNKVINMYKTDNYKKFVERTRDWYLKGYVYKDALISNERPEILVKNNAGISWMVGSEIGFEISKEEMTGYKVRGVQLNPGIINTGTMNKMTWVIPSYSKDAEAAVKFLNLMYTNADICNLLSWGIEGRDYTVKSNGTVGYPTGVTASNVPYHSSDIPWGNQFITKVWEGNPPDLRTQAKVANQGAITSPLLGFSINTTPVQNEIVMIANVIAQYRPALESGQIDPRTGLPEFIRALDAAGAEKVVTEIQKQVDAWRATKK